MMMPARVAMALQADGWWLRSEIIWHKPTMPESVTDRPTTRLSCEQVGALLLRRDAVRVPAVDSRWIAIISTPRDRMGVTPSGNEKSDTESERTAGANLRNVWTIPTHSFSEAHFATFPPKLVEPCIKAGTSEPCGECGSPWKRQVDRELQEIKPGNKRTDEKNSKASGRGISGTRKPQRQRQPDGHRPASTRPPPFQP